MGSEKLEGEEGGISKNSFKYFDLFSKVPLWVFQNLHCAVIHLDTFSKYFYGAFITLHATVHNPFIWVN